LLWSKRRRKPEDAARDGGTTGRQSGEVVNPARRGSAARRGETFPFHLLPAFSTRYPLSTPRADVPAGNRLPF